MSMKNIETTQYSCLKCDDNNSENHFSSKQSLIFIYTHILEKIVGCYQPNTSKIITLLNTNKFLI